MRFLCRLLVIVICILLLLGQYYSSRCILVGGVSAALTSQGIYCRVIVENNPAYWPLHLLENPPKPILFNNNKVQG